MNYPSCNRCHGPLDPGYRFCKTCGLDQANPFAQVQMQEQAAMSEEKQTIRVLLIIIAIRYGISLVHSFGYKVLYAIGINYSVVRIFGYLLSFGMIVALIYFGATLRHKMAKLLIWIVLGIEVLIQLRNFFSPDIPFVYFNF